jgi:excisionase family DNA binding protein
MREERGEDLIGGWKSRLHPLTQETVCWSAIMTAPISLDQVLPDGMYALAELAPLLKVSATTLNREANAGRLTAAKVRGQWRVQGKDFLAYLEACKDGGRKPRREETTSPPGQGSPFRKLNSDRLLASWRQQDADLDQPGGHSAP